MKVFDILDRSISLALLTVLSFINLIAFHAALRNVYREPDRIQMAFRQNGSEPLHSTCELIISPQLKKKVNLFTCLSVHSQ